MFRHNTHLGTLEKKESLLSLEEALKSVYQHQPPPWNLDLEIDQSSTYGTFVPLLGKLQSMGILLHLVVDPIEAP